MTRRDRDRLADITGTIAAIRRHLERGSLDDDLVLDAVRDRLIEIGEAAKGLPTELTRSEPELPWRQIASMRDYLAHRYFDTSIAILEATVENDLPELERAVERMLERVEED